MWFICIGETFLNSSFESNDKGLMIEGYNLIKSDHQSNRIPKEAMFIFIAKSL